MFLDVSMDVSIYFFTLNFQLNTAFLQNLDSFMDVSMDVSFCLIYCYI